MAHATTLPLLPLLLVFTTFLAMPGETGAARELPQNPKNTDTKKPDSFVDPDGSALIPGFGRVFFPPLLGHLPSSTPYGGTDGGLGNTGGLGGGYIPGGDDTFVPNPGVEVPNPIGNVPAAARP